MWEVPSWAAGSAEPGRIAQSTSGSSALDGERLFLTFSDCQVLVGSGLLLHTLLIAVRLMLLGVSDGRSAEHSALFAVWQMFC